MASYMTVEQADNLVNELYISSDDEYKVWNDLSNGDKQVLLNRTSSKLVGENHFLWVGKKVDAAQELDFPRLYKGKTIIFDKLMMIGLLSILLRGEIEKSSDYKDMHREGIKRFSDGGGMSVEFSDKISATATQSGLNGVVGGINGVPVDIFKQYFIDKSLIAG